MDKKRWGKGKEREMNRGGEKVGEGRALPLTLM